jgi:hypothetical protein
MGPFSDLNTLLRDGSSLRYNRAGYGPQEVTITTHRIGELILTSGNLLAWDLLMIPDERYGLKKALGPGRYPVVVSVAEFRPVGDTRIACVMLRVGEGPTVRWEPAALNDPDVNRTEERFSYGVDSGTGSFMDVEVARALARLDWEEAGRYDRFEQFCDKVLAEMERNSFGRHGTAGWADVRVGESTGANVITFSAGWGDGGYASFWGYDAAGELTALVTDFDLFYEG